MSNRNGHQELAQNFMPPEYQDNIDAYKEILREVEFPSENASKSLTVRNMAISKRMFAYSAAQQKFIQSENQQLPQELQGPEELAQILKLSAYSEVITNLSLQTVGQVISLSTGDARAKGDEEAVVRGFEVGQDLIDFRVRNAASAILRATSFLFADYQEIGLDRTVWQKAIDINTPRRQHIPFEVSGEELDELCGLAFTAFNLPTGVGESPVKMGKSRILNVAKAVRLGMKISAKHTKHSLSRATIEGQADLLEMQKARLQTPLEMEPDTTERVMTNVSRTVGYVKRAARVGATILQDPRAQYVFYLNTQLNRFDLESEQAVFQRDVHKFAAALGSSS
jgi:hypothetical protein